MSESQVLDYYSMLGHNRDVFLLNRPDAFAAYDTIHQTFTRIGDVPATKRDSRGRSHVGLVPLVLLMQRQALSAFWSFASHQSYQGWVVLRPCIESALIIGKWIDDPKNAKIWNERDKNRKAYRKTYEGRALVSHSLPRARDIRAVLTRINDDFMHMNSKYYERHTEAAPGGPDYTNLLVHYFDRDPNEHLAHVFSFLHLLVVTQQALCDTWRSLFPDAANLQAGMTLFEDKFSPIVNQLVRSADHVRPILEELGLWAVQPAA